MEDRLREMEVRIESVNDNVELILGAIRGNKITGDGGMVQDMKNLEHQIENLDVKVSERMKNLEERLKPVETYVARMSWTVVIVIFIGSLVGGVIGLVFAYLSLKK